MAKNSNSDWNGPQSSEDLGREKLRKDTSGLGYPAPKSIEKRVDEAWNFDSGFCGRLPKSE
jgi:hypothetical protein